MKKAVLCLLPLVLILSCSKTNLEPEEFGDIEGIIINSETEEGIENVNISTTPPSSSILTGSDGSFQINNLPVGGYTIQARKPGFKNNSVSIAVRAEDVTTARIFLEPVEEEEEDPPAEETVISAEVTSWFNAVSGDSSFVEVEYSVANVSERTDAAEFQVIFEIQTSGDTFFFDVDGTDLQQGQQDIGDFRKFIRSETASDVVVSDTWFREEAEDDGQ